MSGYIYIFDFRYRYRYANTKGYYTLVRDASQNNIRKLLAIKRTITWSFIKIPSYNFNFNFWCSVLDLI